MSKKIFLAILVFMLSVINVDATVVKKDDVPVDTYVIGSHMLRHRDYIESNNYDGKLTTKIIMLSSKTINSDDIDDMVIYYKNPMGEWWDGETGQSIQAPESFDVEYIDLSRYAPTLMVCKKDENGNRCTGYDLFVYYMQNYTEVKDDKVIYYLRGMLFGIADDDYHYEIAEKVGDTYTTLPLNEEGLAKVELSSGERRTFVTRYYTLDENNNPVYSAYSNECELAGLGVSMFTVSFDYNDDETDIQKQIVINGGKVTEPLNPQKEGYKFIGWQLGDEIFDFDTPITESITLVAKYEIDIKKPVLTIGDTDNYFTHTLRVTNYSDYCTIEECNGGDTDEYDIDGFELYLKNGDKIYEDTKLSAYSVTLTPGIARYYVARVYRIGSDNNRIYSEYSNDILIDYSIAKPTLSCDITSYENGYYNYNCLVNSDDYKVSDSVYYPEYFELYRKNNIGNYEIVDSKNINQNISISVEAGTKKTFAARVYTKDNENNNISSNYSDELTIDWTTYTAPQIEIASSGYYEDSNGFLLDLYANWENYRTKICDSEQNECNVDTIKDFEWFLKEESGDRSFYDGGYGGTASVSVPEGEKITVYARAYAKDSHNEKIYGEKSNEIVIDFTNPEYTFEVNDYEDDNTKMEVKAYINNYEVSINKLIIDENEISSSSNELFLVDKTLVENLDELELKLSSTKTVTATKKSN